MAVQLSKFIDTNTNIVAHCLPWLLILSGRLKNRHFDFYSTCYDEPEDILNSPLALLHLTESQ